ncbi:zinc ribbon domain-containing protein [Anaerosacchariphilus polymeriproducens]|nr:zinc ribbon domain-containing protein [Anaerosacchariphilus polymeriproducens]
MAFLDKLNSFAKNVGEKTNDVIEINKMNLKITNEKASIAEKQKLIGKYYYNKYTLGESVDDEVLVFCKAIDDHKRIIRESEDVIQMIKDERETMKKESRETQENENTVYDVPYESGITCTNCGHTNNEGMKFCGQCGNKLE